MGIPLPGAINNAIVEEERREIIWLDIEKLNPRSNLAGQVSCRV